MKDDESKIKAKRSKANPNGNKTAKSQLFPLLQPVSNTFYMTFFFTFAVIIFTAHTVLIC
jgi:hypothetical protein